MNPAKFPRDGKKVRCEGVATKFTGPAGEVVFLAPTKGSLMAQIELLSPMVALFPSKFCRAKLLKLEAKR